jgi:hypothetical protein
VPFFCFKFLLDLGKNALKNNILGNFWGIFGEL